MKANYLVFDHHENDVRFGLTGERTDMKAVDFIRVRGLRVRATQRYTVVRSKDPFIVTDEFDKNQIQAVELNYDKNL